ncbi:MAG: tetratricopeptide repeat protein [Rhodoferax sp.]|nr:tetratricopeptide repeat protein [Rhodoferax sp.]
MEDAGRCLAPAGSCRRGRWRPCKEAAALSPSDAEAHNNLGATLKALGRLDEAC